VGKRQKKKLEKPIRARHKEKKTTGDKRGGGGLTKGRGAKKGRLEPLRGDRLKNPRLSRKKKKGETWKGGRLKRHGSGNAGDSREEAAGLTAWIGKDDEPWGIKFAASRRS